MSIDFHGRVVDKPEIRAGAIGCGSHSFRNVYPVYQFAPVNLVATCDLIREKAEAFAKKFGAERAYTDYREMMDKEDLDAVFIVTKYDDKGRPLYPDLTVDCLEAGCHVWIEKPPAASCAEIDRMAAAAQSTGKHVGVGMKKMFFPANEKAKELMDSEDFGRVSLVTLQYPVAVPTTEEFHTYIEQHERVPSVVSFLDHLCHPVSLLIYLLGMPATLSYERAETGAGIATFTFGSGEIATIAMTHGASINGGMERTVVVSNAAHHIVVDNNIRVSYHHNPIIGYGDTPNYYQGEKENAIIAWEPEFSLGQLYNKGLFLLGYYNEINEFARSILENRPPAKGTLEQAWQVTRIFEAFAEGPGNRIWLT